jgi:predicted Zn-dependent protease
MLNMKYGREDELQSDTLGVRFMSQAGYGTTRAR